LWDTAIVGQSATLLPLSIDLSAKREPLVISHIQPMTKNVTSDFDRIEQALAGEDVSSRASTAAAHKIQPFKFFSFLN